MSTQADVDRFGLERDQQAQGVESAGDGGPERNARGWPILQANDPCDGINPITGRQCIRNWHNAHHIDAAGTKWLDDE